MASRKVPADLLQAVVDHFNPRKVILFGSRARAGARRDSDHDLLVIVDDDIPPEKLHWRALYEARKRYRKAVDIVPYRQSTYDDQLGVVGTLPHIAEADGVVVFDRARRAQAAE
jgi:predicted nucleotidyltransferase